MKLRRRISAGAEIHLGGSLVDKALQKIGRLGTPGSAIGVDRGGVGEHALQRRVHHRNVVEPGGHGQPEIGNEGAELVQVGAHGGNQIDPHGQKAPVGIHRHLGGREIVAPVGVDHEVLRPLANPLHRPPEALRGDKRHRILRIDEILGAEPAADVRGDDTQPLLLDAENVAGDDVAHAMAALRAVVSV